MEQLINRLAAEEAMRDGLGSFLKLMDNVRTSRTPRGPGKAAKQAKRRAAFKASRVARRTQRAKGG